MSKINSHEVNYSQRESNWVSKSTFLDTDQWDKEDRHEEQDLVNRFNRKVPWRTLWALGPTDQGNSLYQIYVRNSTCQRTCHEKEDEVGVLHCFKIVCGRWDFPILLLHVPTSFFKWALILPIQQTHPIIHANAEHPLSVRAVSMKAASLLHWVYLPTWFHLDLRLGCTCFKQPPKCFVQIKWQH